MSEIWLFSSAVLVLLIAPGPTNALLAMGGAQAGFPRSLPLLGAELLGYSLAILIIHLVLQPVLTFYPSLRLAFKIAFAVYAVYLAFRLWRYAGKRSDSSGPVTFRSLFIVTLLNPKAFGFALVLIPFDHPQIIVYLVLFVFFVLATGGIWLLTGAMAMRFGGARAQFSVSRVASLVMVLFAGLIVYSAITG